MTQDASVYSKIFRRVNLDPDIDTLAKESSQLVARILSKMKDDYFRNLLFPPSIGYDDLFQELLYKLVTTAVKSYVPDWGVPFEGFAHGVLVNHFRYLIRHHGKRASYIPLEYIMGSEYEVQPEDEALLEFHSAELVDEFAHILTPRQRQIFQYRYDDEKITATKMAEYVGCSIPTINREIQNIRAAYICYAMEEHLPMPQGFTFYYEDDAKGVFNND